MTIPGSNRLAQASRLIALQPIQYLRFLSRSTNSIGMLVPVYAAACCIRGSIQAVPRTLMEILGLDMQRTYFNIFVSGSVIDIERDVSSDQFKYAGMLLQGISATPWATIDGWTQILTVQVPRAG